MGMKLSVNSRGQTAPKPQSCHIFEDKFPKLCRAMRCLWQTFLLWGVRISSSNHSVHRRLLWPRSLPFPITERISGEFFCVLFCFSFLFLLPAPSLPLPSFIIGRVGEQAHFHYIRARTPTTPPSFVPTHPATLRWWIDPINCFPWGQEYKPLEDVSICSSCELWVWCEWIAFVWSIYADCKLN